jgi:sulfide dehydrogenase cytochrome subunit
MVAMPAMAQSMGPTAQAVARNCFICHGTDGKNLGPIPRIGGQRYDYLVDQLTQFRTDKRPGTIMNRIAKGYSEEQLRDASQYFANVK